jgi:hypothetical protein
MLRVLVAALFGAAATAIVTPAEAYGITADFLETVDVS